MLWTFVYVVTNAVTRQSQSNVATVIFTRLPQQQGHKDRHVSSSSLFYCHNSIDLLTDANEYRYFELAPCVVVTAIRYTHIVLKRETNCNASEQAHMVNTA